MFGLNRAFQLMLLELRRPDGGGGDGGGPAGGAPTGDQPPAAGGQPSGGQPTGSAPETVPYDRFKTVNDQAKANADRIAELEAQIKGFERQGQSAEERSKAELADAQAAREEAEKKAADLEARAVRTARHGWIRDAAVSAKFHDPADAIARLGDQDFKTEAAAAKAVADLAKDKAHLVQQEAPKGDAASQLQRVLSSGKAGAEEDADGTLTPDAFNALSADELAQLQATKPDVYERSLRAAMAGGN